MKRENYQKYYHAYKRQVEDRLRTVVHSDEPRTVYEPVRYVFRNGGKRVRSVLVLLACEAVGGNARRALDAAAAIEILHNFTLVHDDVMDNASVRRGKPTVHRKWDTNIAILAGDEMIALAYRLLVTIKNPKKNEVLHAFTDAFIEVCEGQGLDKEFERRDNVILDEYLVMIQKKTAKVITAAAEIGALVGGGDDKEVNALRDFGGHLGKAFQIQDDLLDMVGTKRTFGKTIGGDVREGKKTYLLLKAMERVHGEDRRLLRSIGHGNGITGSLVQRIRKIYEREGIMEEAELEIVRHTRLAQDALRLLQPGIATSTLSWLAQRLLERRS